MGVLLLVRMPGVEIAVRDIDVKFLQGLSYTRLVFCAILMMRVVASLARDQPPYRR